jgi:hypothetical protein
VNGYVPDLEELCRTYLSTSSNDAAITFMKASHLGKLERPHGIAAFVKEWLGNTMHLWMWDYKAISSQLHAHGFEGIRRADFNDCEDERFREVEDATRFENCLAIQCRKGSCLS